MSHAPPIGELNASSRSSNRRDLNVSTRSGRSRGPAPSNGPNNNGNNNNNDNSVNDDCNKSMPNLNSSYHPKRNGGDNCSLPNKECRNQNPFLQTRRATAGSLPRNMMYRQPCGVDYAFKSMNQAAFNRGSSNNVSINSDNSNNGRRPRLFRSSLKGRYLYTPPNDNNTPAQQQQQQQLQVKPQLRPPFKPPRPTISSTSSDEIPNIIQDAMNDGQPGVRNHMNKQRSQHVNRSQHINDRSQRMQDGSQSQHMQCSQRMQNDQHSQRMQNITNEQQKRMQDILQNTQQTSVRSMITASTLENSGSQRMLNKSIKSLMNKSIKSNGKSNGKDSWDERNIDDLSDDDVVAKNRCSRCSGCTRRWIKLILLTLGLGVGLSLGLVIGRYSIWSNSISYTTQTNTQVVQTNVTKPTLDIPLPLPDIAARCSASNLPSSLAACQSACDYSACCYPGFTGASCSTNPRCMMYKPYCDVLYAPWSQGTEGVLREVEDEVVEFCRGESLVGGESETRSFLRNRFRTSVQSKSKMNGSSTNVIASTDSSTSICQQYCIAAKCCRVPIIEDTTSDTHFLSPSGIYFNATNGQYLVSNCQVNNARNARLCSKYQLFCPGFETVPLVEPVPGDGHVTYIQTFSPSQSTVGLGASSQSTGTSRPTSQGRIPTVSTGYGPSVIAPTSQPVIPHPPTSQPFARISTVSTADATLVMTPLPTYLRMPTASMYDANLIATLTPTSQPSYVFKMLTTPAAGEGLVTTPTSSTVDSNLIATSQPSPLSNTLSTSAADENLVTSPSMTSQPSSHTQVPNDADSSLSQIPSSQNKIPTTSPAIYAPYTNVQTFCASDWAKAELTSGDESALSNCFYACQDGLCCFPELGYTTASDSCYEGNEEMCEGYTPCLILNDVQIGSASPSQSAVTSLTSPPVSQSRMPTAGNANLVTAPSPTSQPVSQSQATDAALNGTSSIANANSVTAPSPTSSPVSQSQATDAALNDTSSIADANLVTAPSPTSQPLPQAEATALSNQPTTPPIPQPPNIPTTPPIPITTTSNIQTLCSSDTAQFLIMAGDAAARTACFDACQDRLCCFPDVLGLATVLDSCYEGNEAVCEEYLPCVILKDILNVKPGA